MPNKTPKPSYVHQVDNQKIYVFDSLFSKAEIGDIEDFLKMAPLYHFGHDSNYTEHIRQFTSPVMKGEKSKLFYPRSLDLDYRHLLSRVEPLVATYFEESMRLRTIDCNQVLYGDTFSPHHDAIKGSFDVTALLYTNRVWKPEWGGETIYYNGKTDAVVAVSPKPGRLVLFHGSIEHRVAAPTRSCHAFRITLAIKYLPRKQIGKKMKNQKVSTSPRL